MHFDASDITCRIMYTDDEGRCPRRRPFVVAWLLALAGIGLAGALIYAGRRLGWF